MRKIYILLFLILLVGTARAEGFDYANITPHPRLLLRGGEEQLVKRLVVENPDLAKIQQRIFDFADQTLTTPPVLRIKEGKRLLAVSREAFKRIFYLAYTYRMTGDERYATRAVEEMKAVSVFTDWNPTHFLDVGEMTMALAIGYDWLYDRISPEDLRLIREAILEKGFHAADNPKHAWFYMATNNWNSVCNSGLMCGALAIFDEAPVEARAIIEKGMATNPLTMKCYGPDGGYPEGFGYWGYGTSFEVILIASLESALGTDLGLSQTRGFLQSARFMEYMTGPTGDCFCFSDAEHKALANPMLYWFARKLGDESVLWLERQYLGKPNMEFAEDRVLPCLLIFASQVDMNKITPPQSHFWYNRGTTPVFIYRSGWKSINDAYLAVKGGMAATSHAHMDAGSFIYECNGVRWAMDLGMQSYITLESKGVDLWNTTQTGQRWEVYRLCNEAHNTLTLNGHRHQVNGFASFKHLYQSSKCKGAQLDLTPVFRGDARKVTRRIWLDADENLHLTEMLHAGKKEVEVMWVMQTPAEASISDKRTIVLQSKGRKALFRVEESKPVELKIWDNTPPHAYDMANPGTRRIGFVTRVKAGEKASFKISLTMMNQ